MTSKKMEFPVSSDGIRAGLDAILAEADRIGVPREVAHRIAVILDEYCSNLIRHDASVSEESLFGLDLAPVGDGARLTVTDRGNAFDPTRHEVQEATGIGGQGISLMRGLSAALSYRSFDDRNEFEVTVLHDGKPDATD